MSHRHLSLCVVSDDNASVVFSSDLVGARLAVAEAISADAALAFLRLLVKRGDIGHYWPEKGSCRSLLTH